MNRALLACFPASIVVFVACAHPQAVTLTSATQDLAPAAPNAGLAVVTTKDGGVDDTALSTVTKDGGLDLTTVTKDGGVELVAVGAASTKDGGSGEMSFEALSAALGDSKLDLSIDHTDAPASKGLDSNGYAAVGAVHQASADTVKRVGELQVSGGITAAAVRSVVRDSAQRLRACYEHGLRNDPRLAGRVMVSFSVDARGAVEDVEAQSDTLPADVTSCVATVFTSVTFTAPKAPPAKIVVPVDFNKDS